MVILYLSGSLTLKQIKEQGEKIHVVHMLLYLYVRETPSVFAWGLSPFAFGKIHLVNLLFLGACSLLGTVINIENSKGNNQYTT